MKDSFSVLSYNIQAGIGVSKPIQYVTRAHLQLLPTPAKSRTLEEIGVFIAEYDVVCLQEVDLGGRRSGFENQVETIAAVSGHPHIFFQENRVVRNISRHGNAILSRLPASDCRDLDLPGRIGGRGAMLVTLDVEPVTTVVCVHLSLGAEDQRLQLEFLADNLPRHGRRIVCGDFNCPVGAPALNAFCETSGLKVLTRAHKTYPSWKPRLGLDHILSGAPTGPKGARVLDVTLSDHRPVAVRFPRRRAQSTIS